MGGYQQPVASANEYPAIVQRLQRVVRNIVYETFMFIKVYRYENIKISSAQLLSTFRFVLDRHWKIIIIC